MSNKDIILELLEKHDYSNSLVYQYYNILYESNQISCSKSSFKRQVRDHNSKFTGEQFGISEDEIIEDNVRLAKLKQKALDNNRIQNKSFREYARVENAVEELNKELINLLLENSLKEFTQKHYIVDTQYTGIIHITDAHFNELITQTQSLNNSYDFTIASQRLKKLAYHSIRMFESYGLKNVVIAMTGDLLNSDRRLDEKLNMASNRSKATLLSCYLLEQFIIDLNSKFNLTIASVSGNESRVNEEYSFSESVTSDNYDFMIENILKIMFRDCEGISFVDGSCNEKIINIGNSNILIVHGNNLKGVIEKEIHAKIAKYSHKGIVLDYVLFGHIHSAYISDLFARGGSLPGGNAYSDEGLNLLSRASQNIFIVNNTNKDIHGIKVDLQDITNVIGYDINEKLVAYNAKSASKLHEGKAIFQVVI